MLWEIWEGNVGILGNNEENYSNGDSSRKACV